MTETTENSVETFFKTFCGKDSSIKDHEEFEARIKTYIVEQRWVRRPLALSPDICSQYGWKCISSSLLECVTCGAKLSAPEPKIEMFDVYRACMEKIYKDLKSSHKTHCPWPLTPLPDSFVKMSALPKEEALKLFLNRLISSSKDHSVFPQVNDTVLQKLNLNDKQISSLSQLAGLKSKEAEVNEKSAVALAATGWILETKKDQFSKTFIICRSCHRSIRLDSFNTATCEVASTSHQAENSSSIRNGSTAESPSTNSTFRNKRLKREDFDPVDEHRPWCLWVTNAKQKSDFTVQSNGAVSTNGNVVGWQIFLKSLLRNVSDSEQTVQENPSKEQIRSVRSLLETWTNLPA